MHFLASAFKTSTNVRVVFAKEQEHQRKYVRPKLTKIVEKFKLRKKPSVQFQKIHVFVKNVQRFGASLAQTFHFVSSGT